MLLVACIALAGELAGCAVQNTGTGSTEPASRAHNAKIAFSRLDNRDGQSHIFIMKADGTGVKEPAAKAVGDSPNPSPTFSPNGKRLAFEGGSSEFYVDIYVMNADGSGPKRITQEPTFDSMGSWSPDGTRIVFSRVEITSMFVSASPSARSNRDSSDENGIYTIRVDGTGLRRLTDKAHDEYPAWSPDEETIAFGRLTKHAGWIYTVNPGGGGLSKLTDPPRESWDSQPSWSPDGTKIAFSRSSARRADMFLMNADGTHVRKLTGETDGFSPAFSPDGKKIVFVSNDGQTTHIYVMNVDGTNVRGLTTKTKVNDDAPDWQRFPKVVAERCRLLR
jgi:Tol biopolymer transport system component